MKQSWNLKGATCVRHVSGALDARADVIDLAPDEELGDADDGDCLGTRVSRGGVDPTTANNSTTGEPGTLVGAAPRHVASVGWSGRRDYCSGSARRREAMARGSLGPSVIVTNLWWVPVASVCASASPAGRAGFPV